MSASDALDLYAKVEDLLGVKEAAPTLYSYYTKFLEQVKFDSILDLGCGSGDFLHMVKDSFSPNRVLGIDLSPKMVEASIKKGIPANVTNICDIDESFDVVTAVFDMVNYLDDLELKEALACIQSLLNRGGYFLCDINTLYGFEEVAVGSFIADDDDRFLSIDSYFEDSLYESQFTLFMKDSNGYFHKSQETIKQYYHRSNRLGEYLGGMDLVVADNVSLYEGGADKSFLVFQKRG